MRKLLFLIIWLLLIPTTLGAVDLAPYKNLSPTMSECLKDKLGRKLFGQLESGVAPDGEYQWKKANKIYARCVTRLDQGIPSGVDYYDGPFFDAMSQIDETVNMKQAIMLVRKAGVDKLALFARSRKSLGQNEKAVLKLAKKNPDLIVLGAPKYFRHKRDVSSRFIDATMRGIVDHNYRFVGEILYTHADKKSGKTYSSGERYTDPALRGTKELLTRLSEIKTPLMTHFEVYAPERDFPRFHKLYRDWPDQIFIIPHMAFASVEQATEFLERHPNVYMTMSKKHVLMDDFQDSDKLEKIGRPMLECMKLKPEWRDFLIRFQDRILAATDAHMKKLWKDYLSVVFLQRVVLGQLPRDVAEKIAYKNAEKAYGVLVK
ncbi:amidohydrolase family protein [Maridesulfovibrio ferrireducens]|uniref:amidohydrolase family protein n=1 Tax=Maridesulfovibrio ferrireducens TaxID=246191 RepID=UPI001A2706F5|nr:amidohydrolase family protein [Maridesulfovibrio ferrireducens]MBI9111832.1 amidohydrolase family protein [Maridesulfovibrio ferrireducens]